MVPSPGKQFDITPRSVCYRLLGHDLYNAYLTFQREIHFPFTACIYGSHREWQMIRAQVLLHPPGDVPNPIVYQGFMKWIHSGKTNWAIRIPPPTNGNAINFPLTETCGHAVHPAIRMDFAFHPACPSCLSQRSISALKRACETLNSLRRVLDNPSNDSALLVENAKMARKSLMPIWRFEKLHWLQLVWRWERLSAIEAAWEAAQARLPEEWVLCTARYLKGTESATKALRMLWAADPHQVEGALLPFVPGAPLNVRVYAMQTGSSSKGKSVMQPSQSGGLNPPHPLRSHPTSADPDQPSGSTYTSQGSSHAPSEPHSEPREKKSVRWASSVLEWPARHSRNYLRGTPHYMPGRHACPSVWGWEDTSFSRDPNWFADHGYWNVNDNVEDGSEEDVLDDISGISDEEMDGDEGDGDESDFSDYSDFSDVSDDISASSDTVDQDDNNDNGSEGSAGGNDNDDGDDGDHSGNSDEQEDEDDDDDEKVGSDDLEAWWKRYVLDGADTDDTQMTDQPEAQPTQTSNGSSITNKGVNNSQAIVPGVTSGGYLATNAFDLHLRPPVSGASGAILNPALSASGERTDSTRSHTDLHAQHAVISEDGLAQGTAVTHAAGLGVEQPGDVYASLMQFNWASSSSTDVGGQSARKRATAESDDGSLSPLSSVKRQKTSPDEDDA